MAGRTALAMGLRPTAIMAVCWNMPLPQAGGLDQAESRVDSVSKNPSESTRRRIPTMTSKVNAASTEISELPSHHRKSLRASVVFATNVESTVFNPAPMRFYKSYKSACARLEI